MVNSAIAPNFKTYDWQTYSCAYYQSGDSNSAATPLLLIHPIGVGLSARFWDRFCRNWVEGGNDRPIFAPDLLGCGKSAMPHATYLPEDWASQLAFFIKEVIGQPVIVVVQGALLPVALELVHYHPEQVKGLVFSGPPAWPLMIEDTADWLQRIRWNLFDSPLGWGFYVYACQEGFLRQFSIDQLFARAEDVDREWLDTLREGCQSFESRHAVYAFLSGFWRRDYRKIMAAIAQPVLVLMGDEASSISREGDQETPDQRLAAYETALSQVQLESMPGRNVLPYESTVAFVTFVRSFIANYQI
ncbi:alpha/beta fold hydrolase [Candidatus Synechococcus calcipolaris]|nr:alpha/beta hydrolase [Candidatus Synechococcus calcipolaris]